MPRTDNYARRAISQRTGDITERHRNLVEHADACLTFPEVPNYRDSYLYLYPDASMAACSDEGYPSIVDGYDLTILTAIFQVCADLPNPCPCRLVCCPDSHLRCWNCDATADLVLVGSLPLGLRRARCRTCHEKWQLGFLDYVRRTAP